MKKIKPKVKGDERRKFYQMGVEETKEKMLNWAKHL